MRYVILDNKGDIITIRSNSIIAERIKQKLKDKYHEWFGVLFGEKLLWISRSKKYYADGRRKVRL